MVEEALQARNSQETHFFHVLEAYDRVLPKYGIDPKTESGVLAILLRMNMAPETCWQKKLANVPKSHSFPPVQRSAPSLSQQREVLGNQITSREVSPNYSVHVSLSNAKNQAAVQLERRLNRFKARSKI